MAASGLKGDRSISIETEEHDARVRRDINRRDGCTTARCPRISPRTCREASRTSWRRADRRLRRWVVRAWAALTLTSVTWTSPPSAAAHVDQTTKQAIVEALRHESLPCPARGLEFVLYAEPVIRSATTEPGFELNLNSGARMSFRADYEPGEERHWFAIDRAILAATENRCSAHGPVHSSLRFHEARFLKLSQRRWSGIETLKSWAAMPS